jgi:uncharacterized membrane protein
MSRLLYSRPRHEMVRLRAVSGVIAVAVLPRPTTLTLDSDLSAMSFRITVVSSLRMSIVKVVVIIVAAFAYSRHFDVLH